MSGPSPEKLSPFIMDQQWLADRVDFFLRFCLPSVIAQSNRNFKWLIYLDTLTPADVLEMIQSRQDVHLKIEFCFVHDFDEMLSDLRHRLGSCVDSHVITTRLDNDDIIGPGFIRMIQDVFVPGSPAMININAGYVYYADRRILTRWTYKKTNQFSSIIELVSSKPFHTIYGFPHWRPPDNIPTIEISHQPGWVEMVHGGNNRRRRLTGIPVFTNRDMAALGLHQSDFPISIWAASIYAIKWLPGVILRRCREWFTG